MKFSSLLFFLLTAPFLMAQNIPVEEEVPMEEVFEIDEYPLFQGELDIEPTFPGERLNSLTIY